MRRVAALSMLLMLVAVGVPTSARGESSLYQRLGGRRGIAVVVDDFAAVLVADERVNARFKAMKVPEVNRFKSHLADQVCDATGGPCAYLGRDMKTAHKGLAISETEWDATVEGLVKALDKNGVPEKERNELLGLLGPMKPDIVGQ